MASPNISLLKEQLEKYMDGYKGGVFVTINTQYAENPKSERDQVEIDERRLYRFTNGKLNELSKRTNRYCFGRSYIRKDARLNVVSAIEIGKTRERLHAHSMMLHRGNTDRTYEEMSRFVYDNCKRIFAIKGENAYKVEPFDADRFWESYITKETKKIFHLFDGFMNIDVH